MLPYNTTFYSPNFSTYKRNQKNIKFLILHYTGMKSESQAIKRLTDYNSKVSCHYFIKKSGKIILMVPDGYIAWHAGKSKWKKINSLNKFSIGIEIHNGGHKYNYPNFTKKQILSVIKLCKNLKNKYKIKKQNILGHSDISYNRKNLQREFKKYVGTQLEDQSIRQCEQISVKEYNSELDSVRKLFLEGNKI